MKAVDEWQGLANMLGSLIAKYACTLNENQVSHQEDEIDLHENHSSKNQNDVASSGAA